MICTWVLRAFLPFAWQEGRAPTCTIGAIAKFRARVRFADITHFIAWGTKPDDPGKIFF
jgi:hypothetical protein